MPTFNQPSYRAAQSDLAISVSPLGLIELSDEEFEIHGPRLNRYASNWAMYLGHHWGYRREAGETQLTFNYAKAFSDYITNFTFGRGFKNKTPMATEAIVPALLDRVWNVDNDKKKVTWRMGQTGSVTGDCFVKVAYEDPYVDPIGRGIPGRVRVIPLHSAFCMPVDQSEALTRRGWVSADDLTTDDQVLSRDPESGELVWADVEGVNTFDWDGPMHRFESERFSALTTPDHRWMFRTKRGKEEIRTSDEIAQTTASGALVLAGGAATHFPSEKKYTDEFVELVGWVTTEGSLHDVSKPRRGAGFALHQSREHNPEFCDRINRLAAVFKEQGLSVWSKDYDGSVHWYFPAEIGHEVRAVLGENKDILPEFLTSLTFSQALLLYKTLLDADGDTRRARGEYFFQNSPERVSAFQMLAMMLGKRTRAAWQDRTRTYDGEPTSAGTTTSYQNDVLWQKDMRQSVEHYEGRVWCPTTSTGTWVTRFTTEDGRKFTYHTGNCFPEWHPHDRERIVRFKLKYRFWGTAPDGTRQVFTYTEIMTDDMIEEYINDEMIDQRPNPVGKIPIVHISNMPVEGSPWGLSDIQDIITLNREYNEKATEISEIINYHASPVTVITGAKASNLEKGPKQVWGNLPKDANVFNLDMTTNLSGPLAFMESLKRAMHEMTGVPESALGERQPISNTSGVALAIEFQPLMNRFGIKEMQYGEGLQRINELILLTLAAKEPYSLQYDASKDSDLKPGQYPVLDPLDPLTYQTTVDFPPPLPTDVLIKLNEIQTKMEMGMESKRGAMRELGEEFPDEKLSEIFGEMRDDMFDQGALDMLQAQIMQIIQQTTGVVLDGKGAQMPGAEAEAKAAASGEGGVTSAGDAAPLPGMGISPDPDDMLNKLVSKAYGARLAQRRGAKADEDS